MRTSLVSRSSAPVLNRKNFGGLAVSNYTCCFDELENIFVEKCDLSTDYEWYAPTLLATLAEQMKYWRNYETANPVKGLMSLIDSVVEAYTNDDMMNCIEWDDFDDYIALLLIAGEMCESGAVSEEDLFYFNDVDDD